MNSPYIDQCSGIIRQINPEVFYSTPLGHEIGRSRTHSFRSLGTITVTEGEIPIGLKIAAGTPENLKIPLATMHMLIHFVATRDPSFLAYLPRFTALLQVEGQPQAILTEDMSMGSQRLVSPMRTSRHVREMIYGAFSELGEYSQVMNTEVCDRSLSFRVGNSERLLDFTPLPVQVPIQSLPKFVQIKGDLNAAINDLTITIAQDTILGSALRGQ